MPKIDRALKNYLTPEILEETHLREIFLAISFFKKVVGFVLAAMLEGILLPSNMAAKTTFCLYLVKWPRTITARLDSKCARGMNKPLLKTSGADALPSMKKIRKTLGRGGCHSPPTSFYVQGLSLFL